MIPILIVAHFSEHVKVLHTIAVASALAQLIAVSFKNIPITSLASLGIAASLYKVDPSEYWTLAKSVGLAVFIQHSLIAYFNQTFTIGEAAIIAQMIELGKKLNFLGELEPVHKLMLALPLMSSISAFNFVAFAKVFPFLNNPITPFIIFAGYAALMKFSSFNILDSIPR